MTHHEILTRFFRRPQLLVHSEASPRPSSSVAPLGTRAFLAEFTGMSQVRPHCRCVSD
jgi:hypothetical protein